MAVKLIRGGSPNLPWEYVGLAADPKPTEGVPPGSTFLEADTAIKSMFSGVTWYPIAERTTITGSLPNQTLEEQLTEADDVAGTLTFAEDIRCIEIYNTDATNAGVFNVNGINVNVPASKVIKAVIGGTASAEITVTGATTYIVSRYV